MLMHFHGIVCEKQIRKCVFQSLALGSASLGLLLSLTQVFSELSDIEHRELRGLRGLGILHQQQFYMGQLQGPDNASLTVPALFCHQIHTVYPELSFFMIFQLIKTSTEPKT